MKKTLEGDAAAKTLVEMAARHDKTRYVLKLYVAGASRRSASAIKAVTALCEAHLKDRYELEIIDIYQRPTLAKGEQILAAPTLLKKLPLPLKRIIGDMASTDKVLVGLDLRAKTKE